MELAWLLWLVFGFFALMVIVGWLTSSELKAGPAAPQHLTQGIPPARETPAPRSKKSPPRKKSS